MASLGRAIRDRRQSLGWTTFSLSKRAGVSDVYLRKLERGEGKRIGIEMVVRLASALGIGTDDLLHDAGLGTEQPLAGEMDGIYGQLNQVERRAWLRVGKALVDMHHEYAALQEGPEGVEEPSLYEPLAAYENADLQRVRRREGG